MAKVSLRGVTLREGVDAVANRLMEIDRQREEWEQQQQPPSHSNKKYLNRMIEKAVDVIMAAEERRRKNEQQQQQSQQPANIQSAHSRDSEKQKEALASDTIVLKEEE